MIPPPKKNKSFPEKKFDFISNKDLFDDDFKESVVRTCDVIRILKCSGFYLLGGGGKLPPKSSPEKKFKAISSKDLFEDYFKESVKVTNVQKCDFSQS